MGTLQKKITDSFLRFPYLPGLTAKKEASHAAGRSASPSAQKPPTISRPQIHSPNANTEANLGAEFSNGAKDDAFSSSLTTPPTSSDSPAHGLPTLTRSDVESCDKEGTTRSRISTTHKYPPINPRSPNLSPSPSNADVDLSRHLASEPAAKYGTKDPLHPSNGAHEASSFERTLTQASTSRSSQRISKSGDVYIANSDGESDDSLEDMDDIINNHRPQFQPIQADRTVIDRADISEENKPSRGKRKAAAYPTISTKAPRFSLKALLEKGKQYEASKEDIARAKAFLTSPSEVGPEEYNPDLVVMENLVEKSGAFDDKDRLRQAILRTEALHQQASWSFLASPPLSFELPDCPPLGRCKLKPAMTEPVTRQQAFLSGFVGDYARADALPEELLDWVLDAACFESRDDLRYAYTDLLLQVSGSAGTLADADRLKSLLRRIGARDEATCLDSPIQPEMRPSGNKDDRNLVQRLSPLLDVLLALKGCLDEATTIYATCVVCRMLLDNAISSNAQLQLSTEQVIASLLDNVMHTPGTSESPGKSSSRNSIQAPPPTSAAFVNGQISSQIVASLFNTIKHPSLRVLLLRNLPIVTLPCVLLRQQLALSWFLNDPSANGHSVTLAELTSRLSQPDFKVSNLTDFDSFTASIRLLDVALDACSDRPPPVPASCSHADLQKHKAAGKAFNESVDELAAILKSKFLSIVDNGASDMRRTEAKEALESLRGRLLYGIRTEPPPKQRLFEEKEIEDFTGEKKGMESFITAVKKRDTTVDETMQEKIKQDPAGFGVAKPRFGRP